MSEALTDKQKLEFAIALKVMEMRFDEEKDDAEEENINDCITKYGEQLPYKWNT